MADIKSSATQSRSTALLLAASGGLLDAVTYAVHHGVFASALSGNLVLLGLTLVHPDRLEALRHLNPIVAALAGVFCARALRVEPAARVVTLSLVFEATLLLLCGLLTHHLPGAAVVAIAAFAGAFQMANFRKVDRFSYNSTFVSGNLRDLTEGCFEAIDHASSDANPGTRLRGRRKVRDFGLLTLAFLAGVAVGGTLAHPFGDRAFWAAIPLLLVALRTSRNSA